MKYFQHFPVKDSLFAKILHHLEDNCSVIPLLVPHNRADLSCAGRLLSGLLLLPGLHLHKGRLRGEVGHQPGPLDRGEAHQ